MLEGRADQFVLRAPEVFLGGPAADALSRRQFVGRRPTRNLVVAAPDGRSERVLLPGTAFGLGADYADAESFLERGAPVALATDFNPNCYSQSMPFAMTLGCVEMGLTPARALDASTNAARAVDRPDAGRLKRGSPADLAVLDAPSHVYLSYNFGVNSVETVVVGGETVVDGGVVEREAVA